MTTFRRNYVIVPIIALVVALTLSACASQNEADTQEENKTQIEATTYKDINGGDFPVLTASSTDFTNAGFQVGDSCDVEFENGYTLNDVPYFSGEYVEDGKPVIVAGVNFADVVIKNKNANLWSPAELYEGGDVKITLNTQGKYADVEQSNNPNSNNSTENSNNSTES